MKILTSAVVAIFVALLLQAASANGNACLYEPEKVQSRASTQPADSPEQLVSSLYKAFPADSEDVIEWQKKDVLARYFDSRLVDLFLKDQECQKREQGICNLDFMPLYDAQDYEIKEFGVGAFDPVKSTVAVRFDNFGKPTVLIYQMSQTPGGWRISDIRYKHGHSLVGILSR